ncbi:putative calcium-binding protein CML28 [Dichanthelium oligosanthes]|uniref:Putative calcium-binding protein CML28 n=1 Tax=Dichanthelium oligosanthes TaxID=888268 RepID=A0A1E5V5A5_9POAL|nr:putative calcium-binding protein CML28 [Dichanthelium oligosanthes]
MDSSELRRVFQMFDKDGDGQITKKELGESFRNLGIYIPDDELDATMGKIDANGDGCVDVEEFGMLYRSIVGEGQGADADKRDEEEDMREAFNVFDQNGDGYITVEELRSVLSSLGLKQGRTAEDCRKMISKVDADGDGRVDFTEFKQMMRGGGVCRAWRRLRLHRNAPVVNIDLRDFLMIDGCTLYDPAIYGLLVALGERRSRPVETLDLTYSAVDRDMRAHADNLMERVQPHKIRISISRGCGLATGELLNAFFRRLDKWVLYVPQFMAGDLELRGGDHRVPVLDGIGAELLSVLSLSQAVLLDAPRLRSLRSLKLSVVTVAVPLAPGAWCPLLERLRVEHAAVDVRLPRLKLLVMDEVDVGSAGREDAPFGDVAVDAPELEELAVSCSTRWAEDYRSFTLRGPALWHLCWHEQFAQRVRVDVGNPGSVSEGTIQFTSNGVRNEMSCCEMKFFRAMMMKMLRGLLPDLPPRSIADVARPYMTMGICTVVEEDTGEVIPEELTCDLGGLMMPRDI